MTDEAKALAFPPRRSAEQQEATARRAVEGMAAIRRAAEDAGRMAGTVVLSIRAFGDALRASDEVSPPG